MRSPEDASSSRPSPRTSARSSRARCSAPSTPRWRPCSTAGGAAASSGARLQGLAFLGGLAVLTLLSLALSHGAQTAQSALAAAGLPLVGRVLIAVGAPMLGLAAGALFFLAVYTCVPRVRVPARTARRAALVSAVLWEAAKVGFGVYTGALGAFGAYRALAFAAGLLAWIYLTAVIILLGAEVMKANTARAELG